MAIASGEAAYRVQGEAGSGYLVDSEGSGATLIIGGVRGLSADQLYELWLIDADLAGFTTFAVTIEDAPVERPTSDPVMVGPFEG